MKSHAEEPVRWAASLRRRLVATGVAQRRGEFLEFVGYEYQRLIHEYKRLAREY
ncbi:hypothetical protein I8751_02775 [Nostocaceae cyanobacterium CENA357]|uniref:Uncharacterized protein n=1 Tax=Atlanticothrix silvestris CENA357 TaxID=1725252 RepID=A0A8J7H8A4_9CYAN|nr:hypothetical protein [Atlanticothrix silvestris]MBH8551323.1 hypothetical protein [Atlanticothrix silvestris CENA357]